MPAAGPLELRVLAIGNGGLAVIPPAAAADRRERPEHSHSPGLGGDAAYNAVVVIFAILGEFGLRYFADLAKGIRGLKESGGAEAMDELLDGYAIAQVVALAILADGETSETERATLARVAAEELDDVGEANRLLGQIEFQALTVGDHAALARAVHVAAGRLTPALRRRAYDLVVELAADGSGLVGKRGYRVYRPTDPDGLLAAVADGLDIALSS